MCDEAVVGRAPRDHRGHPRAIREVQASGRSGLNRRDARRFRRRAGQRARRQLMRIRFGREPAMIEPGRGSCRAMTRRWISDVPS